MSVVQSVEELGPCRKKMTVEVPAPAVDAEMRRVVEEYRRRVRLPGFRKGKAPERLVRTRFHRDIEQEVIERLVPRYWRQAEAETEIDAMLPPQLGEVDLAEGAALTFVATVETRPHIEVKSLDGIELPEAAIEPGPDEIERTLEDLQRRAGEWKPVERPAARGDLVTGELAEAAGEAEPQEVSFEVGDPKVWEELSLAASGAAAGHEVELTRRQGEGEAAVERRYRLRLTGVQERQLAPLDDALAAEAGGFASVEELREDVRAKLRLMKQAERRAKRERALLDELRGRHPVALPEGVVHREIEQMLGEYAEDLAKRGVDPQAPGLDWQRLAEQVRPQAERRVHARLILDAVAQHRGLEVGEDDFQRALAGLAKARGESAAAVRASLDKSGRLGLLRAELLREKTIKQLLNEDGEEAAAAPPASPDEG